MTIRGSRLLGNRFSLGFREVALPATSGAGEYVVTLKNGRELRVPTLFSEKRVKQLIDILERC